jgi:hypothetical protein
MPADGARVLDEECAHGRSEVEAHVRSSATIIGKIERIVNAACGDQAIYETRCKRRRVLPVLPREHAIE